MMKTALPILALGLALATSSCVVEVPENSMTPPAAGVSTRPDMSPPPELRTKPNGDIEVVFQGGCVCIFDQYGNLKEGGDPATILISIVHAKRSRRISRSSAPISTMFDGGLLPSAGRPESAWADNGA